MAAKALQAKVDELEAINAKLIEQLQQKEAATLEALTEENRKLRESIEDKEKRRTQEPEIANSVSNELSKLTATLASMSQKMEATDTKVNQLTEELQGIKNPGNPVPPQQAESAAKATSSVETARRLAEILNLNSDSIALEGSEADDLKQGKTLKSGRDLRTENAIVRKVPWPHMAVERTTDNRGPDYDTITASEFICGFYALLEDPANAEMKPHLSAYFKNMTDDIKDYPNDWETLRAFHYLVTNRIERGLINWDSKEELNIMRQKFVFAVATPQTKIVTSTVSPAATPSPTTAESKDPVIVCADFNINMCRWKKDHTGAKHCCAYCYATGRGTLFHPQARCYRLNPNQDRGNRQGGPGKRDGP
ncbi:MAG: hypothetical protein GY774_31590 [Planctomycetes bacterium]|nr:hypothetical protein [Planctomycetota bacterium]